MRLFLLLLVLGFPVLLNAQQPAPPAVAGRAWALFDVGSGQLLAAQNADERIEPASLTKLMTAYLSFSALREKKLSLTQSVTVSERAWKAQGSRMFIAPDKAVTVDELLNGMIVQSGNDASVALAEAVAGAEESFVQMMNREAQRLGLTQTRFTNATGLSDPQHYSTARDLALLTTAMIRDFPEHYPRYAQKEYTYNRITQTNRNRLLWQDAAVDGVKTGHTEAAGYCLIASAKRGPRRLIAVVLGTASDAQRAQEAQKLLNFGFQFYETAQLYANGQTVSEFRVWKGEKNNVKTGFLTDFVLSLPAGQSAKLKANMVSRQPLLAPLAKGQAIGTLQLTLDGKPFGEYPVVALEDVPLAGWFGRLWDALRLWLQ